MQLKPAMNYYLKGKTPEAWIDYAIECGFRCMEITASHLPEERSRQDEIIALARAKGFELSLHSAFGKNNIIDTDEENRVKSIAQAKAAIDLAASHDLQCVTFHPGRLSSEEESVQEKWEQLLKTVGEIAAYAKEKRVRVGLENMERRKFELVYTIEDLNRFAELGKDNPYFGVTLDFAHFSSHGILKPDLSKLKLPIHNVHLSQGLDGKMHVPLTVAPGMVDLKSVCQVLKASGYDSLVVFEVTGDHLNGRLLLEETMAQV